MMQTALASESVPVLGPYKVDASRGTRIDRVSSEWYSWPGDERALMSLEHSSTWLASHADV